MDHYGSPSICVPMDPCSAAALDDETMTRALVSPRQDDAATRGSRESKRGVVIDGFADLREVLY